MLRDIQSFVRDDRDRWVAQLECGHLVDVPPDAHPPAPEWSRTEHGRKNLVGSLLECPSCLAGLRAARPEPGVVQADAIRPSWRSFLVRPKARPARIEPIWLDSKIACGSVQSIPDLERLARLGFQDVLSLDQAGELGQALSPHIEASWIRALAMTPHWVPIDPARIHDEDVDRFLDIVGSTQGPVLVHSNGVERANAFSTIWLGIARGLDASQALRASAAAGLRIGKRCAELVDEQLSRLLAGDERVRAAPHRCFSFIDPPHVPHWDELEGTRHAAVQSEPPRRSNVTSGKSEVIRRETDGGSRALDEPPPLVGGAASEGLLEESPRRLVGATCSPHAPPGA